MEIPNIKTVITYLEMRQDPHLTQLDLPGFEIRHESKPDVQFYLNLYRDVGRDYIWNYRPGQTVDEIKRLIHSAQNELHVLYKDGRAIGMAELDVTDAKNVEIIHFGLIPAFTDQKIGREFLACVVAMLWARGIDRVWLSTCGLDHPKAIRFYRAAGFDIYALKTGEFKDWRFGDFYDREDAPQIPLAVPFFNCQTTH